MMYCPNCKQEYDDGNFCPVCGTKLINKPIDSGVSVNLGDATAISGGLHVSDSHNVHNEDRSVHNITNTTSTVNNITQVAAQKSEIELLQEKKAIYLTECKRAYEDNVLEQSEVVVLEECRIKLGLDKSTADAILESVRVMSERNARKTTLNPIARTKLKILTDNLQKNEVKALMDQIDGLEPLVRMYDHDELTRKFFLVLAALKSERCIELKENFKIDSYWKSFWSYLAYIKSGRIADAENVLISLDRFTNYPEDNMSVLAVAGAMMMGKTSEAKEYLDAVTGEYTPALQRFVDSIYLLLEPEVAKEMGADENTCAFYLVNFFGQKDLKAKAEEERLKREAAEAERRRKEVEEQKRKEDEARKKAENLKKTIEETGATINLITETKRKDNDVATKSAIKQYNVQPQTIKELRSIISSRLRKDKNADLNDIDISKVKDMSGLFKGLKIGKIDISKWDVSKVEMMYQMFYNCENFDCDLSNWDVSKVKSMNEMFVGCKQFEGKGLENWDVSQTLECNKSRMFLGCDSINNVPSWYYRKIIGSNDYEQKKWLPQIRKTAEQGDAFAQFLIGLYYYQEKKDYNEAIKWFIKASDQDYASAQLLLGHCYYEGQGVAKDYNEAMKSWRKAFDNGNITAMLEIGNLYANGYGVKKDENEAVRWWRKANDADSSIGHYGFKSSSVPSISDFEQEVYILHSSGYNSSFNTFK